MQSNIPGKAWWKRMFTLLLVLILLWLAAVGAVWLAAALTSQGDRYDAIVVLGAQVLPTGQPNRILKTRLETALARYREHPCTVVCTGAQGDNEPEAEGDAMRRYLIERGVRPEDALAETASYNTYQNLENAKALLPEDATVLVVTSDYHLPRALRIARDKGLNAVGAGSPTYWVWRFKNHTREFLSWGKYLLTRLGLMEEA